MEPTDQPDYRRAEFITRTIAGLAACGIALYAFSGQAAAIFFALSLLVTLCHVCAVNPARLMWRLLRRAVGHRFDTRFTWGELNLYRPGWRVGFQMGEDTYEEKADHLWIQMFIFSVWIYLPWKFCRRFRPAGTAAVDKGSDFGFYTIDSSIVWRWACGYWSWQIPFFSYNHLSTEVLSIDGKRTVFVEYSGRGKRPDRYEEKKAIECANCEVHAYTCTRHNGEVQHRMATIHVSRMTWTRKWFPFLELVKTYVDVAFNKEIGEEVGSWKGGTTGCSWTMKPGQTALQALRDMEAERFFEKGRHRTRSEEKKSTTRGFLARLFLP